MSRETRTLRPFSVPAAFGDALQLARFHMGEQVCEADSRIMVDSADDFLRAKPALSWARNDAEMETFRSLLQQGVNESGIPASELGLIVTAYSSYLKIVDVCFQAPLSDCASVKRITSLAECRPRALYASTHGATLSAYVALLAPQEQQALRPWRKGAWLARAEFRVSLETAAAAIFRPTPLTDARRSEFGLPKQTLRYFTLDDHDPFRPYNDTERPTFYVDEELLSRLNADPTSALSKAIQAQLACDFIAGLIAACNARNADVPSWDDAKESLIGRVVRRVVGEKASRSECEEALLMATKNPTKFIARAEHALDVKRVLLKSFSESP